MVNNKGKHFWRLASTKTQVGKTTDGYPATKNVCTTSSKEISCSEKHIVSAREMFSMVEEGNAKIDQYSLIETMLEKQETVQVSGEMSASEKDSWKLRADIAHECYINGRYDDALGHLISIKKDIIKVPKDESSIFFDANADFLIASIFEEKGEPDTALSTYNQALQSYRDIIVVCAATGPNSPVKLAATEKVCLTLTRISDIYCLKSDWKASLKTSEDALSVFDTVSNKKLHSSSFSKLEGRILDQIEAAEEILGLRKKQNVRKRAGPKFCSEVEIAVAESLLWLADTAGNFVNKNSDHWFKTIDELMGRVLDERKH